MKRTAFLILILISIGGLLFAGGGRQQQGQTGDARLGLNPPAGHNPRAFQAVPPGPWSTPYPLPVQITAVADHATNWYFFDGDDVSYNPWTRLYRDELNVYVDFEWTSVDQYPTRLNLAISARALPDVFAIPSSMDPRIFNELVEENILLDLTESYRSHASQRIRDFEQVDPHTIQGFTVNNRIYGIPRYYYGQIDQPWHLWVRKDWYEAAGSPPIRTVTDLENLARTFMQRYGGFGIAADNTLQWLFRTAPMFGAYIGNIHENNYFWRPDASGRLRPGIAFPEFLVALEHWQRWYREGIINPDFMTLEPWSTAREDIFNGRVGIQAWWQWWGWGYGPDTVALQGNNAYFIPLNMPTLDGRQPARGQIFYPNTGVIVANRNMQNPAALMKVLSLVDHMVFGPDANLTAQDLRLYMEEGREHAMTSTFKIIDPSSDMLQYQYVLRALNARNPSSLFTTGMLSKYTDSLAWIDNQSPHGLGAYLQMGFEGSAYARSQHLFDINRVVTTAMWGPAPAEFDQAGSTGDIIMEEVMQIIMGNRPVSHFNQVLQTWYAQGGRIKEDAVNLHYGRR